MKQKKIKFLATWGQIPTDWLELHSKMRDGEGWVAICLPGSNLEKTLG